MFISFFYKLREAGVPVSPTSFLTFHRAVHKGLVQSIDDFYVAARTVLVKSERYFDLYDRVFNHIFAGASLPGEADEEFDFWAHSLLDEWLKNPGQTAAALGVDRDRLDDLRLDELLAYFRDRLREQTSRHDGGSKWIGTGGTSPVGHAGIHPGGLRIGGISRNKSAVQVAGERRYRDYSADGPLTSSSMSEALKKLRNMIPQGARDQLNIDATIYQTMKNGGEIEIVYDRRAVDRLKVILAIDNGGWSMEPHVEVVRVLFSYAHAQFRELKTCYFHNTIYDLLWEDPSRCKKPWHLDEIVKVDPDTRLIIVGDASMAPYELMVPDGSIYAYQRSGLPSIERLKHLAKLFRHGVWLNPVPRYRWGHTRTIQMIRAIFPMFELSLQGLEEAVSYLMKK